MAKTRIKQAMQRIKVARPGAEIAVYSCTGDSLDMIETRFAGTVASRQDIKSGNPRLVGVFHGLMSMQSVEKVLWQTLYAKVGMRERTQ